VRARPPSGLGLLSPLLALAVWEALARAHLLDVRFFPPPSSILRAAWGAAQSGELWDNVRISLARIAAGFALGALPGLALGIAMGLAPWVRLACMPLVSAVYPIPKSAILPLIMLVFGIGEVSKWVFIGVGVFFPVLLNAMVGVLTIDGIYLDVGRNYGARGLNFLTTIALPGALPVIFAGIKLGFGLALVLVVIAEIVASRAGIGFLIWNA
jgi:NitT/TauT family transport system permease protein